MGVDSSELAVVYAKERYGSPKVTFACSNAMDFRHGVLFETVVSLETVEHLDNPRLVFRHLISLVALAVGLSFPLPSHLLWMLTPTTLSIFPSELFCNSAQRTD